MHGSSGAGIIKAGRALAYLVYFFVLLTLAICVMGFFLLLFGANPDASFTEWVYRALNKVMAPFRGIFESIDLSGNSVLDTSVLFAMIVYGMLGLALRALIDWLTYRMMLIQQNTAAISAGSQPPQPPVPPPGQPR